MLNIRNFLVLVNCVICIIGSTTNSSECPKDNPIPDLERYFSRSLYQNLALERREGNLLVSPLGVDLLLATLLEGAYGEDREHLTRLLGLDKVDGYPYCNFKTGYLQLLKNLTSILQISTNFYIHNDFVVNKDFLSVANDYYQTRVEMLNMTNEEEAAKAINSFVKKNTNQTIGDVVTEVDLSGDSTMVCISTTHFQDQWAQLFPKQVTSKQQFRPSSTTHSLVHMMRVKNQFHLVWDATLQAKVLSLDFNTKNVSMIFMLPDKEDELLDLESRLATTDFIPLLNLLRSTPPVNVDLWMPRFTIREDLDLGQTLEQMSLANLFTPEADLSGISSGGGLHVSKIKQKSHLVVGENGAEASSTEVVETGVGTEEDYWQEFHADHPFIFFLIMNKLVIYQGRVVKP